MTWSKYPEISQPNNNQSRLGATLTNWVERIGVPVIPNVLFLEPAVEPCKLNILTRFELGVVEIGIEDSTALWSDLAIVVGVVQSRHNLG